MQLVRQANLAALQYFALSCANFYLEKNSIVTNFCHLALLAELYYYTVFCVKLKDLLLKPIK